MMIDNLTLVGIGVLTFVVGFYFGICLTNPRCDRRYGHLAERVTRLLAQGVRRMRCGLCRRLPIRLALICAGLPCEHDPRPSF